MVLSSLAGPDLRLGHQRMTMLLLATTSSRGHQPSQSAAAIEAVSSMRRLS